MSERKSIINTELLNDILYPKLNPTTLTKVFCDLSEMVAGRNDLEENLVQDLQKYLLDFADKYCIEKVGPTVRSITRFEKKMTEEPTIQNPKQTKTKESGRTRGDQVRQIRDSGHIEN